MRRAVVGRIVTLAIAAACVVGNPTSAEAESGSPTIPEEWRDENAIVLEDVGEWVWSAGGKARYDLRQRILIQTERGLDLADQTIVYNAADTKILAFKAATVRPDGTRVELPDDLLQEVVLAKGDGFEFRLVQFTFPAVEPGATIEWSYTEKQKDPLPLLTWGVQRKIPVLLSRFEARARYPYADANRFESRSRSALADECETVENERRRGERVYELICRNVPPLRTEPFDPPLADHLLAVHVALRPIGRSLHQLLWDSKSEYMRGRVESFLRKSKRTHEVADSLVSKDAPIPERIDAIHRYLRTELEFDDEADDAATADDVIAAGRGSRDDLTLVMLAMLRRVGVSAEPVMANDRSGRRFEWELPSFGQANHLLLRLDVDGNASFLDPGCRFCATGLPDWRYCETEPSAVTIQPLTARAVRVGEVPARFNSEILTEEITIDESGRATVTGQVLYGAQYDVEQRRRWEDLSETARREDFLNGLSHGLSDAQVTFSDLEDPFAPLQVDYSAADLDLPRTADGRLLIRASDAIGRRLPIPMQDSRTLPIWVPFRFARQFRTRIHVPETFALPELPPPEQVPGPGMRFQSVWKFAEDDPRSLVWTGTFLMDRTVVPPDEFPAARQFTIDLQRALQGGVLLRPVATAELQP